MELYQSRRGFVEAIVYNLMNSFSQACTTFVGQNYGAGEIGRCRKTLTLCLIEDGIATGLAITLGLVAGRFLLSIFNSDPVVVEIGYSRLTIILSAYVFSMLYETAIPILQLLQPQTAILTLQPSRELNRYCTT